MIYKTKFDDIFSVFKNQHFIHFCTYTCMHACMLSRFSHVLCVTPWTAANQAPLSMGFSRQEYWSGLPCPHSWDLLDPGD